MGEIIEVIVIVFGLFASVLMAAKISDSSMKCEECGKVISVQYNSTDSIYFAVCNDCNILYYVE